MWKCTYRWLVILIFIYILKIQSLTLRRVINGLSHKYHKSLTKLNVSVTELFKPLVEHGIIFTQAYVHQQGGRITYWTLPDKRTYFQTGIDR
jgi:hypothetical protein